MALKILTSSQSEELLGILKVRFETHQNRHKGIHWAEVYARLQDRPERLWSLNEMEQTGGEPDVVGFEIATGEYIFFDCAPESPKGRRSICYDHVALEARKEHKPLDSAINMAAEMDIEILNETEYRQLQQLGAFDTKTSGWLATPAGIRKLGGAIFGDRRYNTVFIYHNGAESYYNARGFRGSLRV